MNTNTAINMNPSSQSEEMSDADFESIVKIAKDQAGLMITEKKRALVQSRITKRLRALGLADFKSYLATVSSVEDPTELAKMISVLTTNVSSFFRENHHFNKLRDEILINQLERAKGGERVRIWSAGCSSGQEPFSIAMTILDALPEVDRYDIKILATDIDQEILKVAKKAEYERDQLTEVPDHFQRRYFETTSNNPNSVTVVGAVRELVSFRELNLLHDWPMRGPFDAIFCRNVVIYFDEQTQLSLWPKFRDKIGIGGTLFVGHSERIPDPSQFNFAVDGVTSYCAV